jgi:4'-phosphopantetheinyl transferase
MNVYPRIASLTLAHDEIHVWRLYWRLGPEIDPSPLNEEEQAKAARIRCEKTQGQFIAARSWLRLLLGRYLRKDPAALSFVLGERGKPRLAGTAPDAGLVFNVSHAGDWVLIALARDRALGVDVEAPRAMRDMDGIAERCFAPRELAYWRALPLAASEEAFFAFWTCKEAFVKAVGQGVFLGLENCVIELGPPAPKLVSVPASCGDPGDWRLYDLSAGMIPRVALCTNKGNARVFLDDAYSRLLA